jgi:cell division protein FtsL
MSELNITDKLVDKIADALNKSVKKTDIFEKAEKIEVIALCSGFCISIIGLLTIYNTYSILSIKNKIKKYEKNIKKDSSDEEDKNIFKYF